MFVETSVAAFVETSVAAFVETSVVVVCLLRLV